MTTDDDGDDDDDEEKYNKTTQLCVSKRTVSDLTPNDWAGRV